MILEILIAILAAGGIGLASSVRVVKQFERGVVFRFGRVLGTSRGPGITTLVPIADRLRKVNLQIITMPVPAQEGITRDNVTVRVDAVVYFKVVDPVRAIVDVEDYLFAVGQVAQTSLRSIIGKSDLDDLLSNREKLNQGLEMMIDSPALAWGIEIDRVEIKDVALPESMKRSMARQAEADRERRARIITADGELQASEKLSQAATVMAETPAALQLRLLQTVVEVAAEKNSTLVLPFPVELLRFLERSTEVLGEGGAASSRGGSAAEADSGGEPAAAREPAAVRADRELAAAGLGEPPAPEPVVPETESPTDTELSTPDLAGAGTTASAAAGAEPAGAETGAAPDAVPPLGARIPPAPRHSADGVLSPNGRSGTADSSTVDT